MRPRTSQRFNQAFREDPCPYGPRSGVTEARGCRLLLLLCCCAGVLQLCHNRTLCPVECSFVCNPCAYRTLSDVSQRSQKIIHKRNYISVHVVIEVLVSVAKFQEANADLVVLMKRRPCARPAASFRVEPFCWKISAPRRQRGTHCR